MEKTEYRAVIKYLHLKGMISSEIHEDMEGTLAESAPSYATITRWVRELKRGRDSVEDDPRSGRPPTATTKDSSFKGYPKPLLSDDMIDDDLA